MRSIIALLTVLGRLMKGAAFTHLVSQSFVQNIGDRGKTFFIKIVLLNFQGSFFFRVHKKYFAHNSSGNSSKVQSSQRNEQWEYKRPLAVRERRVARV